MILQYGNAACGRDWQVVEKSAPGFSRIYWVQGGGVTYRDARGERKLEPQHLYIFPTTIPYSMQQNPKNPLRCTYMHVDVFPGRLPECLDFDLTENSLLLNLVSCYSLSIADNNMQLIALLGEAIRAFTLQQKQVSSVDNEISQILDYLHTHFREPLSIERLSRVAGYHPHYFIRYFKKKTHLTPHQYLLQYRLQKAKNMLQTAAAISVIAEETGFADAKAFSRAFGKYMGISPSLYREKYRDQP